MIWLIYGKAKNKQRFFSGYSSLSILKFCVFFCFFILETYQCACQSDNSTNIFAEANVLKNKNGTSK